MGTFRNKWDTARVSDYPEWFQNRDDSLELMLKSLRNEEDPKSDDMGKIFESVYVVLTEWEAENEVKGEDAVPVAAFYGFDTLKEMNEALAKDWNKETVTFVYNTRKKVYYEVEAQLMIDLKEVKPDEEEEISDGGMVTCPDCKGRFMGTLEPHKRAGNCKTYLQREPLPGLQRGAAPTANEVPPGTMGPRKS